MTNLKNLLEQKNMSQMELARKSEISKSQINYFVLGKHDITLRKAKRIADVLEVKIDDLI